METFNVHVLGCGSALPTMKHYASSQVIEVRGKMFMVDCGEGTQIQLRKSRLRFTKIVSVFISHLHGDHCFGLIGLICTFGMLGRTAPLHVYAPKEMGPILQEQIDIFCNSLSFEVVFHEVDTTVHQIIYEDRGITVETIPLEHRIPCCGYIFREKAKRRHILREMIDCYEIPLSQIDNIKAGADWTSPDGEVIPNEVLTVAPDPPRSYAYCSDTRYIPSLHQLVEGVNVLYHESTYDQSHEDRARLYYHSTALQAATVARDAHVGLLMLGHFSARYDDEQVLLEEAQSIFPNTILADEGLTIRVV